MNTLHRLAIVAATVIALSVPTAASLAAANSSTPASKPAAKLKVGLAIIAPLDDKGFNAVANQGLTMAEHRLGVKGTVTVTQQGQDDVAALNAFVTQHYNMIVAVGALWDTAVYQVARSNPKLHFAIVDGTPVDGSGHFAPQPNVASLLFRSEQPGYIVGVLAGLMEKDKVGAATHNSIATLGAEPFPFITAQMCGYYEGAKSVDKTVKFSYAFADSFGDPQKGEQIGQEQISSDNADILFGAADASGLGYYQAAKAGGRYAIGFVKDQDNLGGQMLTSALVNVQVAVLRIIQSQVARKFKAGNHNFSLSNGGVGYATDHMHHVPAKVKSAVAAVARRVTAGKVKVSPTCTAIKA